MERKIAMQALDRRRLGRLYIGLDDSLASAENSSLDGKRTASDTSAVTMKLASANHDIGLNEPPSNARAPRKEVAIAATERRRPVRLWTLSISSR